MARPVWFDVPGRTGPLEAAAVADHLEAAAAAAATPATPATPASVDAVPIPPGTDFAVLHQAALLRARRQLARSHAELDRILAQEVRAIDDLVRTANLLVERLREWYSLHAPEATRLVTGSEELARLVAEHGSRQAVMLALDHAKDAEASLGTDLDAADLAVLQGFAGALSAVHASWTALEARVTDLMQTVAPNVASVVGPVIGARLVALSGGLERLATWPAGTVQLLGAETALFRHLKEGTRPPKHGILFQHPLVHQAPPWSRGATARALALAAATGAKADAFTKNDLREHLAAQLKADLERIALRKSRPRPMEPRFQKGRRDAPRGPGAGGPRRPWQERGPGGPPNRSPSQGPPQHRDGPGGRGPWQRAPPRGPRADAGGQGRSGWAPRGPAGPRDGPRGPGPSGFRPGSGGASGSGGAGGGWRERSGPRAPPPARGPGQGGGGWQGGRGGQGGGSHAGGGGQGGGGQGGGQGGGGQGGGGQGGGGQGGSWGRGPAKPFKRKPQGAFRSDNKPAAPPGRARRDRDDDRGGD